MKDIYSSAQGRILSSTEKPPGSTEPGKSLRLEVDFAGGGQFQHFAARPVKPIYIPGNAKTVTMRIKRSGPGVSDIYFTDGWGREGYNGKGLKIGPTLTASTDWQTVTMSIPDDWVRPVAINGVGTWDSPGEKKTYVLQLDRIEAQTDIADADPETGTLKTWAIKPDAGAKDNVLKAPPATPLISLAFSTPEQSNIFSQEEPKVTFQIKNWNSIPLTGKADFTLLNSKGEKLKAWEQAINVDDSKTYEYPLPMQQFGLYTVKATITLQGKPAMEKQLQMAYVPKLPEPTHAQKEASPYGLNYHSGGPRYFEAFKKAGIYWYRDYAWDYGFMLRAKGTGNYANWPTYPSIMEEYSKLDLIPLPCFMSAIKTPVIKDGKAETLGPDTTWIRNIADILVTFPSIKYWELANEYEADKPEERLDNSRNYNLYHQKFGELCELLGNGGITGVENGHAGIPVFAIENSMKNGAYDKIGVLNVHNYCGTEPPEINFTNFNTNETKKGEERPGSFFDSLRTVKRTALSDGKKREAWLTEFGWDTKVGHVVTVEQQAAYLQRGFLLAFAAGIDRAFWYYNWDNEPAQIFFDGTGLLDFNKQPKLSFCAMAGLSSILPFPKYVGSINAGPNTAGYVFENGGKLVAGLWTIVGNAPGPKVPFDADQLYDYLGNPLSGKEATLQMAPVYAVGLKKSDPLYLQTAYGLETNHMIVATAGDPVEPVIGVSNNRDKTIQSKMHMKIPKGWTVLQPEGTATVEPGQKQDVKMPFLINADEKLGMQEGTFIIEEDGKTVKTIPLAILVQPPFNLQVTALTGTPGKTTIKIEMENRSASEKQGKLSLQLPEGWTHTLSDTDITMKPHERRVFTADLDWKTGWKDSESAKVVFVSAEGKTGQAPIIPNHFRLHKAKNLVANADGKDWPAEYQFPDWMLGSTVGEAKAKLWFAWSPEGLYGAADVQDSKCQTNDTKHFWVGDALELFVSANSNHPEEEYVEGDHQFWLIPSFDDKRVYVGQWKVKSEIPEIRYDITGIQSFAKRTATGYKMKFFIPVANFQKLGLKPGADIGFNANLTVRGQAFDREVFWPRTKANGTNIHPLSWGRIKLEE